MKKNQNINISISNFIFIFLSGFVILFYFMAFGGLILSDDYTYSYNAFNLFNGSFEFNDDIFTHRFGVFFPTSILYFFFGVNDITTTIWPLLCYLITGWLIFSNFKNKDITVAVYAVLISSLNFYPLYFSNKLFPDVIVSFFGVASVFILYNSREKKLNSYLGPLLFSLFFFMGFLSKETMLYVIPFYGIIFLSDLLKRENIFFWAVSISIIVLFSVVYFGVYQYFTDDFFYRFKVIQDGHYAFGYSYFDKPFSSLLERITYEPFFMFISTEIFIPFALALPVLLGLKIKDFINPDTKEKFWSLFSLVLLVMFWFGSTSYKFYNPISLNGRMFIMLVPVISIVAGISISKAIYNNKINIFYAILFFITAVYTYKTHSVNLCAIYGFLFLFFISLYIYSKYWTGGINSSLFVFLFMGILLVHPVYSMMKTDRKNFDDEKEIVRTDLNSNAGRNIVLTDALIKTGSLYFNQFKPKDHYLFLKYKEIEQLKKIRVDKCYILINPKNLQELIACGDKIPGYFIKPPKNWKLVKKRGEVILLEITDINDVLNYH